MAFVEDISDSHNKHATLYAGDVHVTEMELAPGEEIGMEKHNVEQVTYVIRGSGVASFPDAADLETVGAGSVVIVPKHTHHNISNTGSVRMKLLTVYSGNPHPGKQGFARRLENEVPDLYASVVDIVDSLPSFSGTTKDPWQELYREYTSLSRSLGLNWDDVVNFAQDGLREKSVTRERLLSFERSYPMLTFLYARDNADFADALREAGSTRMDRVAADLGLTL